MILLPIILYVPFFLSSELFRRAESVQALLLNLNNRFLSHVVLFPESESITHDTLFSHHKLQFATPRMDRRYRFADVLAYVSERQARRAHIAIVANADIFFDETLSRVRDIEQWDRIVMALTRWDLHSDNGTTFFGEYWSQDAWLFGPWPIELYNASAADYHFGVPGCDNRIAWDLWKSNYCVTNPSLDIRAVHFHTSNHRSYDDSHKLFKPYVFSAPRKLILDERNGLQCDKTHYELYE
jgi:hypothetical protein